MRTPSPRVLTLALIFAFLLNGSSLSLSRATPEMTSGVTKRPAPRKLLSPDAAAGGNGDNAAVTERMGDSCSKDDIVVYQGATAPLPNGIPTYTVQILNVCLSGCAVSDIHVTCGWFSSARLINPRIFRRIQFDDCLVNDGAALGPGDSLSFQYANTYRYPLYVSSVSCYQD